MSIATSYFRLMTQSGIPAAEMPHFESLVGQFKVVSGEGRVFRDVMNTLEHITIPPTVLHPSPSAPVQVIQIDREELATNYLPLRQDASDAPEIRAD